MMIKTVYCKKKKTNSLDFKSTVSGWIASLWSQSVLALRWTIYVARIILTLFLVFERWIRRVGNLSHKCPIQICYNFFFVSFKMFKCWIDMRKNIECLMFPFEFQFFYIVEWYSGLTYCFVHNKFVFVFNRINKYWFFIEMWKYVADFFFKIQVTDITNGTKKRNKIFIFDLYLLLFKI